MTTVNEVLTFLDETYPFSLAEDDDNCGLLIGEANRQISRCLIALDITRDVVKEASKQGAGLIISHHPVIFSPLYRILPDSVVSDCVKSGISVIASHTCLDRAKGGVNDVLCKAVGLHDIGLLDGAEDLVRTGYIDASLKPEEFAALCKDRLGCKAVRFTKGDRPVKRAAVCSGAGSSFVSALRQSDCDAFLTGELKYHEAAALKELGFTVVEAGHFETEVIVIPELASVLKGKFPNLSVVESKACVPPQEWIL